MGCCSATTQSSPQADSAVIEAESHRRRLSIGVDPTVAEPQTIVDESATQLDPVPEEPDGADIAEAQECENKDAVKNQVRASVSKSSRSMKLFSKNNLMFCAGSTKDGGRKSFNEKSMELIGSEPDSGHGIGYTCRKGLKPESPNQDAWMVWKVDPTISIYGVFDGHGSKGHEVADFVKDRLPTMIVNDKRFRTSEMKEMLVDVFQRCHGELVAKQKAGAMSVMSSGTTATVVIHDHVAARCVIAHVADSTCVLGSHDGESLLGRALTRDHKPDLPDERARILSKGGRVVFDGYSNHRVYSRGGVAPGLNMSRSIGDLQGHDQAGITAEPEVSEIDFDVSDDTLILCSDGVWEFITPLQAVTIISKYGDKLTEAAEALAQEAWDRWYEEEKGEVVDDISVVLVKVHASPQVLDGGARM
eukprot:TRINITY_DN17021_c0_g1_i1.p1 TRINITY_DN17021_c0_g1~~TRINITY_DN17021_c0_g1_i1.p1  ORF type:complete len:436 (+),score=64.11 TRINITY_DN17021_c0_g1_i1:57-1310(+)